MTKKRRILAIQIKLFTYRNGDTGRIIFTKDAA